MEEKLKGKKEAEDLINLVLEDAIVSRASDIHIEPLFDNIRVRFRVDGILQEKLTWALEHQSSVINKIKVLSNLDIANQTIPQDGHFEIIASQIEKKEQVKPIKGKKKEGENQERTAGSISEGN